MTATEQMTEEQRAALPICELHTLPSGYTEVVADEGNRCVTVLTCPPSARALQYGCITIGFETFRISDQQLPDLRAAYEAWITEARARHSARWLVEA